MSEPKIDPTAEIWRLEAAEANNFRANQQYIADLMSAYDVLYHLTDSLYPIFWKVVREGDGQSMTILATLFQLMRQDLVKGMLNVCKGYVTDGSFQTRRMIESAAVFIELVKRPAKFPVYADLSTEKARLKYVDKFKVFRLIEANLSKTCQGHYAILCLQVHPSMLASGTRSEIGEGKHFLSFFDIETEDDTAKLRRDILVFLTMAFDAFKELKQAFDGHKDFDIDGWDRACQKFQQVYTAEALKLLQSGVLPSFNESVREFLKEKEQTIEIPDPD